MKHALIFFLLISPVAAAERDAVIRVGDDRMCSAVIVSPDGIALSAEHCRHSGGTVTVAGRKVAYRVLYDPPKNGVDECVVLKLDVADALFVPVSETAPKVGDEVHSWGFPGGKLSYSKGKVTKVGKMTHVDFWTLPGNSGGPLFNADGEVIGISSTRNSLRDKAGSQWIPLSSIQASLRQVTQGRKNTLENNKPVLNILTWKG